MENKKLLLLGGGGHCKSIISSLNKNEFNEVGIIDPELKNGSEIMGVKVIENDDDLFHLKSLGFCYAFISLGSIGDTDLRKILFNKVVNLGFKMVNIIDESASIDKTVSLGKGIFIGKKAIVNAETILEDGCIVNSGSIIEHECHIGKFSHVAPGAVICGNCYIDNDVHIGANSSIKQGITIEEGAMIGMGSVVIKNVMKEMKIYGNPVKVFDGRGVTNNKYLANTVTLIA